MSDAVIRNHSLYERACPRCDQTIQGQSGSRSTIMVWWVCQCRASWEEYISDAEIRRKEPQ